MLQRSDVKNLSVQIIIELVLLSTPQFLTYTFPFSTLTATAMVVGDFSAKNEITAMRSLGISLKQIFLPFFLMSILTTFGTYWIADTVNPFAADQYKNIYARLIKNMPNMILHPNSSTTIGNITVSIGDINKNLLKNIRVFDVSDSNNSKLITAKNGRLQQSERAEYLYSLVLDDPDIMWTSTRELDNWTASKAQSLVYTLDMTSLLPDFSEPGPTQIKGSKLRKAINDEKHSMDISNTNKKKQNYAAASRLADMYTDIISNPSISFAIGNINSFSDLSTKLNTERNKTNYSYRQLYFESELYKRTVLSTACMVLCLLAFTISFFRVRHGRLIGFAISMFVAVIYWAFLFFVQFNSISKFDSIPVLLKMWLPNVFFLIVALLLMLRLNKS